MKFRDVLQNSTGSDEMRGHFCKSYFTLAKRDFFKRHGRYPSVEDSQEVFDLFELQWKDYYVDRPNRERENRIKGKPVWQYGIRYRLDVHYAMCRFMEFKYATLVTGTYGNQYYDKSCADILKEKGIEFMESHIIDSGLMDEWKAYIDNNHKTLHKYHKRTYQDYSHLAYNGVADDL